MPPVAWTDWGVTGWTSGRDICAPSKWAQLAANDEALERVFQLDFAEVQPGYSLYPTFARAYGFRLYFPVWAKYLRLYWYMYIGYSFGSPILYSRALIGGATASDVQSVTANGVYSLKTFTFTNVTAYANSLQLIEVQGAMTTTSYDIALLHSDANKTGPPALIGCYFSRD